MGYKIVARPAIGPDGGCDILVERTLKDHMSPSVELVVVQCKHLAHSERSVDEASLGAWDNARIRNKAAGYLLVTDSRVNQNVMTLFRQFTEERVASREWAAFWDVERLIQLLGEHRAVRDAFFPGAHPESLSIPDEIFQLRDSLARNAYAADRFFDAQDWPAFNRQVTMTRNVLSSFAKRDRHFEFYFHFRRLPRFIELQHVLSAQQLAFERLIESWAVERVATLSKPPRSVTEIEPSLYELDPYHSGVFSQVRQETTRLKGYIEDATSMVMVGCGAFPHTLIHACLTNPGLQCIGLDYENSSLVQAHRVRTSLGLSDRLHYLTQNGNVFDYRGHDLVLIANIVTQKHAVLKRIARTAEKGTIVVVRNPVTFGEILWDDAQYNDINGLEIKDRFEADVFGECSETVVFRVA